MRINSAMAYLSSTTRTSPRPAAEPGCISGASRSSHWPPPRRQPADHGRTVPEPTSAAARTVRSGRCQATRPIVDNFVGYPQIAHEPPIWVLTRVDLEMGRPPRSGGGCLRVGRSMAVVVEVAD